MTRKSYNVGPKEQLLWDRVKQNAKPKEQVRILQLSKNIGLPHQTAKQYVRKWENRGLVKRMGSNLYVKLTDKGFRTDKLEKL